MSEFRGSARRGAVALVEIGQAVARDEHVSVSNVILVHDILLFGGAREVP